MLGLVCHIIDSSVAENQLRTSCVLDFLAVLVLLVPCGLPIYYFSVLSGYFGAATSAGAST